jgi:hypothetical protein
MNLGTIGMGAVSGWTLAAANVSATAVASAMGKLLPLLAIVAALAGVSSIAPFLLASLAAFTCHLLFRAAIKNQSQDISGR